MEGKKYKLINKQTGEEHLCNKITIGGFDYYVSNEQATEGFYGYIDFQGGDIKKVGKHFADDWKKVIATNNPNIDIPKVVDEVELLAKKATKDVIGHNTINEHCFNLGYNKSQETHPFSEEDIKSFGKFCADYEYRIYGSKTQEQLLEIWKEQRVEVIYYD